MRRTVLLLTLAALVGCDESRPAPVTETDSAGIRLVANAHDSAALPLWSLSAEPRLTLGQAEGDPAYQFFRVGDAALLDDGRLVVVNGGTQELRFYDAEGGFLGSVGRSGEGPGEYRFPFRVFELPGDSLLVYDIGLARFTVLDPEDEAARTFRPESALFNEPDLAGLIGDSLLVSHETVYDIPESGFDTMYAQVAFFDLEGRARDTLVVPTRRIGRLENGMVGPPHFEAATSFAAGPDGVWVGTGRDAEVRLYGPDRALRRIVRWDEPARPVTDEALAAERSRYLEGASPGDEPAIRAFFENRPVADVFPVYDRLIVDDAGHLWVRRFPLPHGDGPAAWTVLSPDGHVVARAELPVALRVQEIGRAHVLGTLTDELGVERVVVWQLER